MKVRPEFFVMVAIAALTVGGCGKQQRVSTVTTPPPSAAVREVAKWRAPGALEVKHGHAHSARGEFLKAAIASKLHSAVVGLTEAQARALFGRPLRILRITGNGPSWEYRAELVRGPDGAQRCIAGLLYFNPKGREDGFAFGGVC